VLAALLLWLFGGMLYMWVIELIIQRLFFSDLIPNQLSPTYWIGMGAVAISTLAGATLLQTAAHPLIRLLEPFIAGVTLVFWATGTWWIPWLLIIGVWRHAVMRHPAWYEPGWWGMVFPIGMYTVATATAAQALDLPVFTYIASGFVWLALAAWTGTFANMLITLSRRLLTSKAS
jgi:tellurite resistance protein TehA-like permease